MINTLNRFKNSSASLKISFCGWLFISYLNVDRFLSMVWDHKIEIEMAGPLFGMFMCVGWFFEIKKIMRLAEEELEAKRKHEERTNRKNYSS